jgi:two-component system response regulator MtrA
LIADDDRDTVLTLVELLREEGYEPRGVYRGTDVIEAMHEFDPDVVLLDIAMPDKSGWEVAREIRQLYGEKRPLLIALSGVFDKTVDRLVGKTAGFNYYIAKPYDPSVLMVLIRDG